MRSKTHPLPLYVCYWLQGFAWIYQDLRDINAEQRQFMTKLHESQVLMSESLKELNVRITNIEQNFQTTPAQLKELIFVTS